MIMAMILINKETKERELLWTPEMNDIDEQEEIISALEYYGDEPYIVNWEDGTTSVTGIKYHIQFELIG